MANYQSTHTGAEIDAGIDLLNSNSATSGQVLTANGTGGVSWQDASGTEVVANPSDSATEELSKLQVDGSIYSIPIVELRSSIQALDETKFDKVGGGITGDVNISGNVYISKNLTVAGASIIQEAENLQVKDAVIVTNKDGEALAILSGLAIRKGVNAEGVDETYGIMYDPVSDSVKLGLIHQDESGNYQFLAEEGYPVATRADSADMNDGKVVTWDAEEKRIKTTGIPAAVDDTPTEGSNNLITSGAVYSAIVQTLNTEV